MARFRTAATVLGYRPGETFDVDVDALDEAEAATLDAYVAGGFLAVLDEPAAEVEVIPSGPPATIDVEKATVAELRSWLLANDLPATGRRSDLVERVGEALSERALDILVAGDDTEG